MRLDFLKAEWLHTTKQAQTINTWLRQHNRVQPHQARNMRPPIPETLLENGRTSVPGDSGLDTPNDRVRT
ncbi:MAG: transposase [Boseongicola sp.]|nr:transposase [Boseongicola sp.]NNJ67945.1 hypothetical protein [Boseongicola sp.]